MKLALQILLLALVLAAFVAVDLRLGGQLKDWVRPERGLTAISIVAGFLLLGWQLDRQHRNALRVDATKARNELRLAVYKDLATASETASRKIQETNGTFMGLKFRFSLARQSGTQQGLPSELFALPAVQAQIQAATDGVIGVLAAMEKWEIALGPDFQAFKAAFAKHNEVLRATFTDFVRMAAPYLHPSKYVPGPEEQDAMGATCQRVWDAGMDLTSDLWDLRIATQNRLLNGLFESRIAPRTPGDPSIKPIVVK